MWLGGGQLTVRVRLPWKRPRKAGPFLFLGLLPGIMVSGCEPTNPELIPDEYLQSELGLTPDDRVHSVSISGGTMERADPGEVRVRVGDFVQFVSADWRVHEVMFELDSLRPVAHRFLEGTGQVSSPPLLQQGSRFVLSFSDAPPGRYPFAIAGNTAAGHGVVIVEPDVARR